MSSIQNAVHWRIALVLAGIVIGCPHDSFGDVGNVNASDILGGSVYVSSGPCPAVDSPEKTTDTCDQAIGPANESSVSAETPQPGSKEVASGFSSGTSQIPRGVSAQFATLLTCIRYPPSDKLEDTVRNCDTLLALCRENAGLADRLSADERKSISQLYSWVARLMMEGEYAPQRDDISELANIYNREIVRLLTCALEVQPARWECYFVRGCVRRKLADSAAAIRDLDLAEQHGGPAARVCYARGRLHLELLMLGDALRDLDKGCAANETKDFRLWTARAEVRLLRGDPKEAIGDLERAVAALRNDKDHCVKLQTAFHCAETYRLLGRTEQFEREHKRANEMLLHSSDPNVALVRRMLSQPISSELCAETRIEKTVSYAGGYFNLGMFDECLAQCDKLSTADRQNNGDVQRWLARIHLIRQQPEDAVKCFGRAIEIAEKDVARDYFGRSEGWRRLGKTAESTSDYEHGLRLLRDAEPREDNAFKSGYFLKYLEKHPTKGKDTDTRTRPVD